MLDTGPWVAALDRRDAYHDWATAQFKQLALPFFTCEAVLTEASHLLRRARVDPTVLFQLVKSGAVVVRYDVESDVARVEALMRQYADKPMDFADACLVHMSELWETSHVLTLDTKDFSVYRKHRNQRISLIIP